jgi:hypothetical protein
MSVGRKATHGHGVFVEPHIEAQKGTAHMARGHYRSAISGRYVTSGHGRRSPRTTVFESTANRGSSGGAYRSAITGRFVTSAHGKRSPGTTVRDS